MIIILKPKTNSELEGQLPNVHVKETMLGSNEPPHGKTNKMTVRPAKAQISPGIRPVWSESSMSLNG